MISRRNLLGSISSLSTVVLAGCSRTNDGEKHDLVVVNTRAEAIQVTIRVLGSSEEPLKVYEASIDPERLFTTRIPHADTERIVLKANGTVDQIQYNPQSNCPNADDITIILTVQTDELLVSYSCAP
jgi:hypothetical protein